MKGRHAGHGTRSGRPLDGAITPRSRPARRERRSLAGIVAVAVLTAGIGLALAATRNAPAAGVEATETVTANAASLYLQNCASCHGPQGQGASAGPSLIGVGRASTDFYLRTGRMPLGAPGQRPQRQEPVFDEAEIQALVEHVASFGGDGPDIPQVTAGGDVRRGWELYTANCAACHAATGAGNAVGGGFVAYGLGQATNREIAEAMLIGPGAMPRFQLDPEDRDAIVAYVNFLKSAPAPGGAPIGGFGPVAEGFVAIVVGLTALVLVARFVGRRSHEGEPDSPLPIGDLEAAAETAGSGRGSSSASGSAAAPAAPETRG